MNPIRSIVLLLTALVLNWLLNKAIGDNETGFGGTNDAPYRTEAWDFILAGGALFNHLDYSFTVGHEDGTFHYPSTQPGGGNAVLRRQFRTLRDLIHGFDFVRMKPGNSVIKGGVPAGGSARALVEPGKAYAICIRQRATNPKAPTQPVSSVTALQIELPEGRWRAEWLDTMTGKTTAPTKLDGGGIHTSTSPGFTNDRNRLTTRARMLPLSLSRPGSHLGERADVCELAFKPRRSA
jgi:hypothetical protein